MGFSWRGEVFSKDVSVFLFDDNPLFLENLAFLLNRQNGIRVTGKTTSLEEARQLTQKNPPEVVILGIGMFNKEGYYALLSFWQEQGIPVIVLGLDSKEGEEALRRGASAFFRKGESYPELLATINKIGGEAS
ncbi:MAG: hypothetical protein PWP57_1026 [Candidatus Atribacteria bacterium]|nr:hypothetical protein [Candidatus Atribacteria bacterium]